MYNMFLIEYEVKKKSKDIFFDKDIMISELI